MGASVVISGTWYNVIVKNIGLVLAYPVYTHTH